MPVDLSNEDIQDLKNQGFTDEDIQEAVTQLEREELQENRDRINAGRSSDPRSNAQYSHFASKQNEDIVRWQLELNDILERAEHILKGDKIVFQEGKLIWQENDNPEENTLNKKGVTLIMSILSNYVNRNTILSDYDAEEVKLKVLDFGKELNNLVFMKYEEMGIDSEEKRKEYPILVRQMVDIVHSAYARAKDGGERRSLREMIQIQQTSQMQGQYPVNAGNNQQLVKKRSILNPMRYIGGKYANA